MEEEEDAVPTNAEATTGVQRTTTTVRRTATRGGLTATVVARITAEVRKTKNDGVTATATAIATAPAPED